MRHVRCLASLAVAGALTGALWVSMRMSPATETKYL